MYSNRCDLETRVIEELRPATELERLLASEIAYASWELERVRANTANTPAEQRLNAAYSRASRNWNRARKELQSLQVARFNHFTRLPTRFRPLGAKAPLADPARAPHPRGVSRAMAEYEADVIERQIDSELAGLWEGLDAKLVGEGK